MGLSILYSLMLILFCVNLLAIPLSHLMKYSRFDLHSPAPYIHCSPVLITNHCVYCDRDYKGLLAALICYSRYVLK